VADSTVRSILDAVVSTVAGIDGTGSYTFDLSASGAVRRGRAATPWTTNAPCAAVWTAGSEEITEGVAIGWYREETLVGVQLWVPGTDASSTEHSAQVADAVADLKAAVRADTSLGVSDVMDTLVDEVEYEGDDVQHGGMPTATVILRTRHYTTGRS
jgi:hypothetical protein